MFLNVQYYGSNTIILYINGLDGVFTDFYFCVVLF